jgi:hypothetical protein
MIWTDYDRNELYKVTKGAHFEPKEFEDLYDSGVFDSWKNGRTGTSLYQIVRRQEKGKSMNGVVRQPGVQMNEPVVIQSTQLRGAFSQNLLHNYSVTISGAKINSRSLSSVAIFCLLLRNLYIMKKARSRLYPPIPLVHPSVYTQMSEIGLKVYCYIVL